MKERLFVIMEVEKSERYNEINGTFRYVPKDNPDGNEVLWLRPKSVIPASRLRYEIPKDGDRFLADNLTWVLCGYGVYYPNGIRLILDLPEPTPEELWEEWEAKHPIAPLGYANRKEWVNTMINWLAERPSEEK
uniref:Uncharacterized protein n=1 Tax=viral metagenome TaxID=1070528 RepID=A0A6M3L0X2_9ZZZZ